MTSSSTQPRRRPIVIGCRVEHIDGRSGIVLELIADPELPLAVVDFEPRDRRQPHTRERVALGFIQWVGADTRGLL